MGLRVKRAGRTAMKLEKIGDKTTRHLRRLHREAGYRMADVASEMAPFKTGELEGDIGVEENWQGGRKVLHVTTRNVGYAVYMHEQVYSLGQRSMEKQANTRYAVGRKYLERAAEVVMAEGRYAERAREIVRNASRST